MAQLNLNRAEFVKSAASPQGFVRDSLPRIVFAGKSNVGKSSVINRLLNRKNFARVGATPGKTAVPGALEAIRAALELPEDVPALAFSAEKGTGREQLLAQIYTHI